MMPEHEFCDSCPGCRPAICPLDPATGRAGPTLPDDDPAMVKINDYWDNDTTYEMRKAFIEVTLHNSRLPGDMALARQVTARIQAILGN